jgi:Zn-dependent protease with chaperone function
MDFFARQAEARRQTRWFVVAFVLAVLLVVIGLDVLIFTAFGMALGEGPWRSPLYYAIHYPARYPGVAFFLTAIVLGLIGIASLVKSIQLRQGGGVVARALGGVLVARDTTDLKRKRLHNVVEEMSIASGVPLPEIYILERETSINAFAAGHTPANAAIAVTQGALDTLSRDELQAVIAHEFSHVLNGDMRLNVQLMGWLFGLFVIAYIGRKMLRHSPDGDRAAIPLAIGGLFIMVLGYIGLFFARVMQAAVSRQRERLADASSVQFTRNPDGLKGALLKIAGQGSRIVRADADQAAHMLFAEGLKRFFQTHPSLEERIKALDPRFDVKRLPALASNALNAVPAFEAGELEEASVSHLATAAGSDVVAFDAMASRPVAGAGDRRGALTQPAIEGVPANPGAISAAVGQVETVHITQAKSMRLALPESLREFSESTGRARALVLALLLSRDGEIRERQLTLLGKSTSTADLEIVRSAFPIAESLAPMLRLPAMLQIFPALRRLPASERRGLAKVAEDLIRADARVDVFEFCLAHLLATLLRDELEARAPHGKLSLAESEIDIQVLFAVLAGFGATDVRQARMAYEAGMHSVMPMHRPPYLDVENWPQRLTESLRRLEKLQPFAKKVVIEGLVKTIAHDEKLNVAEAELLRTVCAAMHCPLPPLLPGLLALRR